VFAAGLQAPITHTLHATVNVIQRYKYVYYLVVYISSRCELKTVMDETTTFRRNDKNRKPSEVNAKNVHD
jgi:hypothetical protein